MKKNINFVILLAVVFALPVTLMTACKSVLSSGTLAGTGGRRLQGPCDIYAAAGTPCVAAHSTTRALFASYKGPLYQIIRQSDGKSLDVGVV
ncbi:MAG TPA: arabinofuranosidase catalytic domain-containing protein, partial [Verrucomicrobiae bacterium]|nr:arabinofuranosidase catalytic domain-containing protein [Verrucomicrobiae bacterium]